MIRPTSNTPLLIAAAATCLLSCQSPWWSKSETAEAGDPPRRRVQSADEPRASRTDIKLFGRDSSSEDVSFMSKVATDLKQHTTASQGADFDPDADPSGQFLVYASTRHAPQSHLYVKSVAGATITQITDGAFNDAQPAFDSAGKRIAFTSDRSGQWDIWVMDANGKNPIQITNNPLPDLHPSWSPDGRSIVFSRINSRDNHSELWVVELDKPGVKRLIGEGLFPSWSPRGDKISYQRARERQGRYFSIWTLDIFDEEVLFPTEVASCPTGALLAPEWSPDGRQLTFCIFEELADSSNDPARDSGSAAFASIDLPHRRVDIGVVDVDGRGFQRLTDGHGECFAPTWSTDERIYFSARFDDGETIWSVKPFRPLEQSEPPTARTTNHRRAAQAETFEDEE